MKQSFRFIRELTLRAFIFSFVILLNNNNILAQEYHGGTNPPAYKGGNEVLKKFIEANIKLPDSIKKNGVSGKILVKLVIDETGKVNDVKLMRGIHKECDSEAIRVARLLVDWLPAFNFGKPINCTILLPFEIRSENRINTNQPIGVSGFVTDKSNGKPIQGCLVLIKGTNEGTLTDANGRYELKIPREDFDLEISSIGYISRTERIDKNRIINVELETDYFIINY